MVSAAQARSFAKSTRCCRPQVRAFAKSPHGLPAAGTNFYQKYAWFAGRRHELLPKVRVVCRPQARSFAKSPHGYRPQARTFAKSTHGCGRVGVSSCQRCPLSLAAGTSFCLQPPLLPATGTSSCLDPRFLPAMGASSCLSPPFLPAPGGAIDKEVRCRRRRSRVSTSPQRRRQRLALGRLERRVDENSRGPLSSTRPSAPLGPATRVALCRSSHDMAEV